MTTARESLEKLLPALVWIQTHLDEDLTLASLAGVAGLSESHFHRVFRAGVGETTRGYVERLRLERAAFLLCLHDRSVLDVALDVGYQNHETFTRAFRRRFEEPPMAYRERARFGPPSSGTGARGGLEELAGATLSATRVRKFQPLHLAFIRHTGPYEDVPPTLWDELIDFTREAELTDEPMLLGIGHDSPGVTPPEQLRFDAAIAISRPFEASGRIGYQEHLGGFYAATTHVGPYSTLPAAWAEVFGRVVALEKYSTPGLPVTEFYRTTTMNIEDKLNETELCIPLIEGVS